MQRVSLKSCADVASFYSRHKGLNLRFVECMRAQSRLKSYKLHSSCEIFHLCSLRLSLPDPPVCMTDRLSEILI